jgi:iron complex outermembrane receptor protein
MMNRKRVFWASTALFTGMLLAGAASAQSTGTEATEVEQVVVTGARVRQVDGLAVAQQVGKSRSTVTQEYLSTQTPGNTPLAMLNLQPGVNFTNNDPFGASGGDITIRGFDSQRISLNLDGIQLNDTGNYAIYSNQQPDPETLERVSINQGTTDVDSPTASATGGTINFQTRRPANEFGAIIQPSFGSLNYQRIFALVDTGVVGPWGTSAWFSYSSLTYDLSRNPGDIQKMQVNGRIYQPIGDNGDFAALSFDYNENRNNTYGGKSVANFNNGFVLPGNTETCVLQAPGAGVQNHGTAALNPGCSTFYGGFMNPSNTGNIRGQFKYSLTDKLKITIDPTYQYVLANGGGTTNVAETDQRLQGSFYNPTSAATRIARGVDLNGDGDILDTIRLYSPSNTQTNRYSVNTSLIYQLNDNNRLRLAYTYDRGRHIQTGEYSLTDLNGFPLEPFSAKKGHLTPIRTLDGNVFQKRNRASIAELNQVAFQYVGDFMDGAVTVDLGVRAPFFHRELNNFCYQLDTFNATCSAQTPRVATTGALVSPLPGAPVSYERDYDDVLPNANVTWRFAESQQVYASYSENLSAPRTDDLYDRIPSNPQPETSKNYDLGYRFQSSRLVASAAVFYSSFDNFIARAFTEGTGDNGIPVGETIATSINAGRVTRYGFDGSIGYFITPSLSVYGTISNVESEIKDAIPGTTSTVPLVPAGNELFEIPEWQYGARVEYTYGRATLGLQAKWVDERWTNLTNTETTPSYTVADLDFRYDLGFINEGMYWQFNVDNLFDENYLGDISTDISGARTAKLGSPRSFVSTLRMTF